MQGHTLAKASSIIYFASVQNLILCSFAVKCHHFLPLSRGSLARSLFLYAEMVILPKIMLKAEAKINPALSTMERRRRVHRKLSVIMKRASISKRNIISPKESEIYILDTDLSITSFILSPVLDQTRWMLRVFRWLDRTRGTGPR